MHPYRTPTCNELRASDAGKTVRLSGWIFDIPKQKREKIYEALLTTQIFGQLTRGAHFSLNVNEQKILLCKSISIENITQEEFDRILKEFFETCLLYKATLKHFE